MSVSAENWFPLSRRVSCAAALLVAGFAQADPALTGAGGRTSFATSHCAPVGSILLRAPCGNGGYVVDISYLNVGRGDRSVGLSTAGLDLRIIASLLLAPSVDAYAKVGNSYVTTGANVGPQPAGGGDWAYGAGVQYHLSPTWSLNADWDQYRVNFPDQREGGSLYTVGTRYRF